MTLRSSLQNETIKVGHKTLLPEVNITFITRAERRLLDPRVLRLERVHFNGLAKRWVVKVDGLVYGRTACLQVAGSLAHSAAISRQHTAECGAGLANGDMSNEHYGVHLKAHGV